MYLLHLRTHFGTWQTIRFATVTRLNAYIDQLMEDEPGLEYEVTRPERD